MRANPMLRATSKVLAAIAAIALVTAAPAALSITKEEVMTLAKLGISEDEIIKAIEKDRTIFEMSVTEVIDLKKANVPEKVIKYMLASPKTFGTGKTTAPATTIPEAPTETDDERRARESRMEREAQKLLAEKQAAEEAQRSAYAQGVLGRGRDLADEGKYVESIQAFESFRTQGNFAPDSEEAYFAKFGIANALVKSGLLQAAASQLVEVVLEGPDRPFFQTAFLQLRQLRQKIDYSPPQLERLADFSDKVGTFSQDFQDQFNYVMGEFFHEGTEWGTATAFLDAVTPQSPDYAKAQYLKGFLEIQNDLYKSAVGSFQRAIIATEENESAIEVRDLGFLALARIAYKIGDYDAAIYYYRKVPEGSYKQATAFYESSWVYFLKGDYARALGTFHTLESPYFRHYFYPEMWILESTAYLNLCHFDRSRLALKRFEQEVLPLITPLDSFLTATTKPEEYYRAVEGVLAGSKLYTLPKETVSPVLGNVEFYNLYRTIKQIEGEQARLQTDAARLGEYGTQLLDKLASLRSAAIRQVGLTTRLILGDVLKELQKFRTKYAELEIDLEDILAEEIERQQAARDRGEEPEDLTKETESGGSLAIVGSDRWRWPFEREYWRDEIGSYRSTVADKCVRDDTAGGF